MSMKTQIWMTGILCCGTTALPITYLTLSVGAKPKSMEVWDIVIHENFKKNIVSWERQYLFMGGCVRTCTTEANKEDHIKFHRSRWRSYQLGYELLTSWSYYTECPRRSPGLQSSVIALKIFECEILVWASIASQKGWYGGEESYL